jgi:hypothetical protein
MKNKVFIFINSEFRLFWGLLLYLENVLGLLLPPVGPPHLIGDYYCTILGIITTPAPPPSPNLFGDYYCTIILGIITTLF